MNDIEKYEFDRLGYLIIPQMLSTAEVEGLSKAVDRVEKHAAEHVGTPPFKKSSCIWTLGQELHRDPEFGYHVYGQPGVGNTLIVEDFWNTSPAFDFLVDHPRTMDYIRAIIQEHPTINNSEIRYRYTQNATPAHMGGLIGRKYAYTHANGQISCMMVRMVYFLHDIDQHQGPFSVVPSTHKSGYAVPYKDLATDDEPGMIGLTVRAGDAVLFTENLRHGGLKNISDQTRKTLHVGYGPYWMMSQNLATMDELPYVLPQTRERLTPEQNKLFYGPDWAP